MATSRHLSLRCPDCGSHLKVDAETGAVLFHKAVKRPAAEGKDFDRLLQELDDEKSKAEELFEREVEAHRDRERLLAEKFEEAMRQAEESPDDEPPPRPFDLD